MASLSWMHGREDMDGARASSSAVRPLRAGAAALLLLWAMRSAVPAADWALIPSEDESWLFRVAEALEVLQTANPRAGIETLQEAVTRAPGKLVRAPDPLPGDLATLREALRALAGGKEDAGGTRRFLPVSTLASHCLALVPEEALRLYRELHGKNAADALKRARETGDFEALSEIVQKYFLTPAGAEAAETLGDALLEAGDVRGAADLWRRVLREHDGADGQRERLLEKLTRIASLPGEIPAGGSAPAAGEEPPAGPRRAGPRVETWRRGGELDSGRLAPLPGNALERSWTSDLWSLQGLEKPEDDFDPRQRRQRGTGYLVAEPIYPFTPLIDGDDVYLSGVFSAFRLKGGPDRGFIAGEYRKPVPGHISGEGRPGESFTGRRAYVERSDSAFYAVSLWKKGLGPLGLAVPGPLAALPPEILVTQYVSDRVLAASFMNYDITVEIPIRSLVAFDAGSGDVLWKTGSSSPLREHVEALRQRFPRGEGLAATKSELSFTSPAVIKNGLVVAGGWLQRGYVDSIIRGLDLRDGSTVWETFVSGSKLELTMFGEMAREPYAGAIAERGGVVYYLTQLGALAAIELETGRLLWLTAYDTIFVESTVSRTANLRRALWGPNPPLLVGDVLIVTPRDSEYLYAVDTGRGPEGEAAGGRILWRYNNGSGQLRDLLGMRGGVLYFTGPQGVAALDVRGLPGMPPAPAPAAEGDREPLLRPLYRQGSSQVTTPGALTDAGVVFAEGNLLKLFDFGAMTVTVLAREREPQFLRGRIQVAGGLVFVTGRTSITAYSPVPPQAPPSTPSSPSPPSPPSR